MPGRVLRPTGPLPRPREREKLQLRIVGIGRTKRWRIAAERAFGPEFWRLVEQLNAELVVPMFPFDLSLHRPYQTLAMQFGHNFHLVKQFLTLFAARFFIALLHASQILVAFINCHLVLGWHGFLQ